MLPSFEHAHLAQIQDYYVDDAIAELEAVLAKFDPNPPPYRWCLRRLGTPKVRAFVDFMIAQFR
jgi:DNA-binding transcriptional LysR family regulator